MKVISLLQPWASLYVMGAKKIETRSWPTNYRGPLLVHASAKKTGIGKILADQEPFKQYMPKKEGKVIKEIVDWDALPFGAIIGMVTIEHVVQFQGIEQDFHVWHNREIEWKLTEQERAFGDLSEGRYGWLSSNPKVFPVPIPAKGKLQLWNYEFEGRGTDFILQCKDCGFTGCRDRFPLAKLGIDTNEEEWSQWCIECQSENIECIIENINLP